LSLQTIVQGSLAGRIPARRDVVARRPARATLAPARFSISSMRILETGLALTAIATALLIGHPH